MKLTRRQLRKIINEIYTASPEGVISGEEEDQSPAIKVDDRPFGTAPKRSHISPEVQDLLDMDDPEYTKQAYELSDALQGHPEGTSQTAVDDENYAMIMSKIGNTPLADIVSSPPEGFKLDELLEGNQSLTGAYQVGFELLSNAGSLSIAVVLEYGSASRGPTIQINAFVKDQTDGYFDFFDAVYIDDGLENPGEVQKQLNRLAGELRYRFPGF